MPTIKLLIVEDRGDDIEAWEDFLFAYHAKPAREADQKCIKPIYATTLEKALSYLDKSVDGAIIDLNLGKDHTEGNDVLAQINQLLIRIPSIVFTATPNYVLKEFYCLDVKTKAVHTYDEIIEKFWAVHQTGLLEIMGARGDIEKNLATVYYKNLLPQIDQWISYGNQNSGKTQRALLRHTLNHLLQLLDKDEDQFYPEEFYIYPPLTQNLKTGSIICKKETSVFYVVLSPACDLVLRSNGKIKTDSILLAEVENETIFTQNLKISQKRSQKEKREIENDPNLNKESVAYKKMMERLEEDVSKISEGMYKNNHTLYFHWLPTPQIPDLAFRGGFLNFRKLISLTEEEFDNMFEKPKIQISPPFIKDIVARFASYYGRQGQPEILKPVLSQTSLIPSPNEVPLAPQQKTEQVEEIDFQHDQPLAAPSPILDEAIREIPPTDNPIISDQKSNEQS